MAITSKALGNMRAKFRRAAQRLTKAAEQITGRDAGYGNQLKREAERLENLARQSMVGRGGTNEERNRKIESAYRQLELNAQNLKKSRSMTNKKQIENARARRERQELIQSKKMQMRRNEGRGALDQLFMNDMRKYWAGAEDPNERFSRITEGTGSTSIGEAWDKWYNDVVKQDEGVIKAILNRDYKTLKQMGWSTDLINEAKAYDARGDLYKFIDSRPWVSY